MTEDRELLALAPVFELLDKIISDSWLSRDDKEYLIDLINSCWNPDFEL
jgi:hypothetical protein